MVSQYMTLLLVASAALISVASARQLLKDDDLRVSGEVDGVLYRVVDGYSTTACTSSGCTINTFMTSKTDPSKCAIACITEPQCQSAFYRIKDGQCSLKKYGLSDLALNRVPDTSSWTLAIEITRSSPSSSPSPETSSPSPETSSSPSPESSSSPSPETSSSPSPETSSSPSPKTSSPSTTPVQSPSPELIPEVPFTISARESGDSALTDSSSPSPVSPSPETVSPLQAPASTSNAVGSTVYSTMTLFQGFGIPYGGCGVPMSEMVDDNGKRLPYIALNTLTGTGGVGNFQKGQNCGRWIKITMGTPCGTPNDGSNLAGCVGADFWDPLVPERVIYGYSADSCGDDGWCRNDNHHIDMGKEYMEEQGLATDWQNNRIRWNYLDSTPPGWSQTSYRLTWCVNSSANWRCVIVSNVSNGISKMEGKAAGGGWNVMEQQEPLTTHFIFRNANTYDFTGGKATVRLYDVNGVQYPGEMTIST